MNNCGNNSSLSIYYYRKLKETGTVNLTFTTLPSLRPGVQSGSMRITLKASLLRLGSTDLTASLAREAACQAVNYASSEFAEGVKAIREKRKANFQ